MSRAAVLGLALLALAGAPAAASETKSAAANTPTYQALPPVTAAVTKPDGRQGVFLLNLGVDVKDEALRTLATQSRPRLLDAYGVTTRTFAAGLRPGAVPNMELLAQALQRDTDRVLGKKGATLLLGGLTIN